MRDHGNPIRQVTIPPQIRRAVNRGLDIVFPPQPLWMRLKADHQTSLHMIDDPQCDICGFPFPYDLGDGALCGNCVAARPAYDHARAAFVYDAFSRGPILSFKHGGQTHGLQVFARQLKRAGRHFLQDTDVIIPVPLHPYRLRKRRFNQAALLGRALSRIISVPQESRSLLRVKQTDSQDGKSASGRRRNMQGAFSVPEVRQELVSGQNIVLIDDVLTTGATVEACARTLKRAGAARVDVLTLARVIREETAGGNNNTIM
ncbi:MAG: ComF family protein [Maricaulaceae bacterium]